MNAQSFLLILGWIITHGYFFILLAMLAEGPIVTTAAAFAAAQGYFNIYTIFILSIFGDLITDVVYYAIGHFGRQRLAKRLDKRIGFSLKRFSRIEKLLQKHTFKTLLAIKLTPFLPLPGLIAAGASKLSLKKYSLNTLAITLPKCLIFVLVGFISGEAHYLAIKYFRYTEYALPLAVIIILLISYLYQKISQRVAARIEKV